VVHEASAAGEVGFSESDLDSILKFVYVFLQVYVVYGDYMADRYEL